MRGRRGGLAAYIDRQIFADAASVCCSVLQCVAVCCSVITCYTLSTRHIHVDRRTPAHAMKRSEVVCCGVLQCVAVCCIVLQCVFCLVLQSHHKLHAFD